ncbi:NAD(P)/FAD-dependent oxidoreductase [Microvirga puerhi]|uniref:NADH:ubiquinone reductase (non-electrogenic) n=1 Tax=Microvirga puerhi TaxID=2876078 RepID=A0ABS7VR44_9HYPH|nr:NAD(P)/FAD-dependent oxidoreductase [Microvirga puerhi]MBZ6077393.1 NAD(P)/FAD-dependent oxidoreductase [Microvirga puerhi]
MRLSPRTSVNTAARPRVVIIGAGFGGLEAARALRSVPVDITVIDRHNYHCFQPLLYQVATATLAPSDIAWPIRGILRRQSNATVFMADVTEVDVEQRVVHTDPLAIPYDYLVLATGATHSYFGHDDWAGMAPGLKQIEDATRIRRRILIAFEKAELSPDPAERQRLLTFVIVGGGPTGVEMAGAVAEVARQTLPPEFRNVDLRQSRVILLEAGPRILATFPDDLSAYAQRALERLGVEVRTSTAVTAIDERGVGTAAEHIDAGTVIWGAGVVASPAGQWVGAERDKAGRIKVGPDLAVPGRPEIFAVGDTAAVIGKNGHPVPGIAPAAKQMGRYVADVITARVTGRAAPAPFHYRHQGDLATIGRKAAVVKLKRIHLRGFIGWIFWGLAHIYFLIGIRNRFVVALNWLWNYFTFQRGARLITETGPTVQVSTDAVPPSAPQRGR